MNMMKYQMICGALDIANLPLIEHIINVICNIKKQTERLTNGRLYNIMLLI